MVAVLLARLAIPGGILKRKESIQRGSFPLGHFKRVRLHSRAHHHTLKPLPSYTTKQFYSNKTVSDNYTEPAAGIQVYVKKKYNLKMQFQVMKLRSIWAVGATDCAKKKK